jgi:quercetin dioxygenase-like cupin family protein
VMPCNKLWGSLSIVLGVVVVGGSAAHCQVVSEAAPAKPERARVAFSHALPRLDGGHLKTTIVEVTYGPGESSKPHSHPCPVVGYVVAGAIRTQVRGEAQAVYQAGESFYEPPNGVHQVSGNASDREPAKFLAYFICDHEAPLSVDVPLHRATGDPE